MTELAKSFLDFLRDMLIGAGIGNSQLPGRKAEVADTVLHTIP